MKSTQLETPNEVPDRLWTVRDVAAFLRASPSWVYAQKAAGLIPCRKIGGLVRFVPEEIRGYALGQSKSAVVHAPASP